ncbi:MAG: TolC family protein [Thermoanaerobaculia bacterium]|nr:MAG: TolC family protein [Thermoanaerobaculia bacterium]MBZ0103837.1 TolC family protein [Thermoanaerobaculia bacterium]
MRSAILIALAAPSLWLLAPAPATAADRPSLSLVQALELAHARNPGLTVARETVAEVRGELTAARLRLQENPEIGASAGPRSASEDDPSSTDREVGLEQRLEIGGQRRHRMDRANASIAVAQAAADDAARQLDLAVAETFYEALAARRSVELLEQNEALAAALEELARRRLDLGEGTQLELNTVRVRRAEAARRLAAGRAQREAAYVTLTELLAAPPGEAWELSGDLPAGAEVAGVAELVARAVEARPDLLSTRQEMDRARAAVALADAEAVPDLTLALSYGRDERQDVALGGFRIPLPFVQRNQGERESARAALRASEARLEQRRLAVAADVRRAFQAYEADLAASRLYDADVLAAQHESLELLEQGYAAGEIDYTELVVIQRELLDGQLGALEARRNFALTTARLLAAAHLPQTHARIGGTK